MEGAARNVIDRTACADLGLCIVGTALPFVVNADGGHRHHGEDRMLGWLLKVRIFDGRKTLPDSLLLVSDERILRFEADAAEPRHGKFLTTDHHRDGGLPNLLFYSVTGAGGASGIRHVIDHSSGGKHNLGTFTWPKHFPPTPTA